MPPADFATEDELRDLFSMEPDEALEDHIATHDGVWVRVVGGFRFDMHADIFEEE